MDEASVNYNLKFIINSSNLVDNSDNISNPKDLDDLLCSDQDIIYKDCKDAIHKNDQVVTEENEEMQAEYIQQNDIINSEHDENDDDFDGKDILENSFGDSDLDDGYLDDQPLEPRLEEINEFNLNSTLKNAANSVNDKDSVANGVADPALIDDADNLNPISNDGGDKDTSPDDGQVNYLRFKSQFRLKSEWERICEKYGKDFEEEADVLDLVSGKVLYKDFISKWSI